ncbi:DUF998 domain-containing protein [Paenibacillus agaridevorans]|uniref:DUF998 domain-containing protein n=1 Tax=Paenibacillus agaridevorans TaxID=171404 RepID=UPI001BE40ACD|nr:DUF998 domain-containing protein [Paenibacillus agaridevorans]
MSAFLSVSAKSRVTKWLLRCGMLSAPLFYAVVIAQIFTRSGFDIRRHAISSLTLGDAGWIQCANFIVTGSLTALAAIAIRTVLRGRKGGTWGPLLTAIYGNGMILAGLFRPDPGLGFPSGAPEEAPTTMSGEAAIHSLAFFVAFLALIAANIVFARRFASIGQRRWSSYCIATACLSPLLIVVGMSLVGWVGIIMGIAGIVAFGFVSALATRLQLEVTAA